MIDHIVAQVFALFVSSSSSCLMRALSDSLSDFSIYFTFLHFIPSSFPHFLLLFIFLFRDVVDWNHAHCRWWVGSPGLLDFLRRQREISHVMNGIIFCVCSTSAVSVPSIVLKRCRKERKNNQVKKESQQNQSRWWIWYHDTEWGIRTRLSRLHRKAQWKPNLKVRMYLRSSNVQQTSTGRLVLGAGSSNYSEWNIDDKWSSQEWKSGEMLGASTGRPVYDKFVIDDDMDSDTATELNLSLRSRSFLNRVNVR